MFKINLNNELYEYTEEMTKQQITSEINYKLPFYFHSSHLQNNRYILDTSYNMQDYRYISRPILEPFVKFFTNSSTINLKRKEKSEIMHHLHFRNFYLMKNGHANFYIIHPKYADNFIIDNKVKTDKTTIDFIKREKDFIKCEMKKDDIIFIPNYWFVFIESKSDKTNIEKIQYKSILNEVCFIYDKLKTKS